MLYLLAREDLAQLRRTPYSRLAPSSASVVHDSELYYANPILDVVNVAVLHEHVAYSVESIGDMTIVAEWLTRGV